MKQNWIHIKHKVARWLFSDEVLKIDIERDAFKTVKLQLLKDKEAYRKWANEQTPADAVRFQLKGFNMKSLNGDDGITDNIPEDELDAFLSKAKDMQDNPVYEAVADHIKRNQIQFATLTAPSLTEVNFARATINGISLFEEEIASLVNLHKERNKEDDKDYDKFSSV